MDYQDNIWFAHIAELRKRYPQKKRPWAWSEFTPAKTKRVTRLGKLYLKALRLSSRQDYLSRSKCGVFYRDGKARPYLVGKGWRSV